MGQVLHGSATTTEAIRRAIQHSQESLRTLAKRYGINPKTVAKWKRRTAVADLQTGPKEPKSTVLSIEEEAAIIAFRRHTLLPLDDSLYALQPTIPHLTRSSLHRCLQRHGIGRLLDVEGDKPAKRKFKSYPIGYFHIDIAEVRTAQGKLHMFVAIDRNSKFAFVELHEKATTAVSRQFLLRLIAAVPYKIHTVLTDNGIQFTTPGAGGSAVPLIKEAIANGERFQAPCRQGALPGTCRLLLPARKAPMAGVLKPREEDMTTIITTDELQRLSKAELCILLDRAYQELIHARPGSPGYYAALTSYENIAKVLNQRLIESWRNALRP